MAEAQSSLPAAPVAEAVERLPALGGAELLRVRGRGAVGAAPPALVVGERRIEPLPEPWLGRQAGVWSASYVVPADAIGERATLAWPGGTVAALPEPSTAHGAAARERRAPRRAGAPPGWDAERRALEAELARARALAAEAEARLHAEGLARAALARELERVAAEAPGAELAAARADALAARRALKAEAAAVATLTGALEAERAAHLVARGTAARLAEELAALKRTRPPAAAVLEPAPAPPAPAPTSRGPAAAGRLIADLDAAASALRRAAAPPRRLRDALVSLAHEDQAAAGALLAQMLPAQAALVDAPLSYDLTIRGIGTYAVTLGGGAARVVTLPRPRPAGQADVALSADPPALAEWLAGAEVRIGRWRGRIRRRGRRRALEPLLGLPASRLSLTDAARSGARLDPGLVYRALAHAVDPAGTRGQRFTVAQAVGEETWYLSARDGAGLAVSAEPPAEALDATVTLTRETFDRLLREEPPPPGARPSIRGDRAAVATLRDWAERARRRRD